MQLRYDYMLVRVIPWNIQVYMYNRENIDPRYLGLHVHLRSVRMLKTQQTPPGKHTKTQHMQESLTHLASKHKKA